MLICFPGAPKVSPEAVKREAELDKYLEGRVEGRGEKLYLGLVDHHRNWDIDIIIPFGYDLFLVQCEPHVFPLHYVLNKVSVINIYAEWKT